MNNDNFIPILELRRKLKLRQSDMAKAAGCTEKTYRSWEKGIMPDSFHLKRLAKYFNVSSDYLLGISDISSKSMDVRALHDDIGLSERASQELITLASNYPKRIKTMSMLLEQDEFRAILDAIEFCTRFGAWPTYFEQAIKNMGVEPDHNTKILLKEDRANNRAAAIAAPQQLLGRIAERFINESELNPKKEDSGNG